MTYQGGPLTDEVMIFSSSLKEHFLCLMWCNFSLHPRDEEKSVSPQRVSHVSQELVMVRWGKFWRHHSHSSPLETASSLCWVLEILPLLQRSICHLFFVSSLKHCQLLLTTEIQLQRQALGTALAGSSGLQLFLWWLKLILLTLSMGRIFPSVL